jgi:choline-sulfatase
MNRRRFLSWTANTLGAFGLGIENLEAQKASSASGTQNETVPGKRTRPNVLILMSDQHKRSCMGVAGDRVAITPNLDKLARQSVRFTNAYCTNPLCAPSRASILTGRYTHNLESRGNSRPYSPRHKTLAHHFSRAGYLSALIGKMHFVDAQTHGFDYELEFNDWFQYLGPKAKLFADELGHPGSGAGLPQISSLWKGEGDPWKDIRQPDGRQGPVAVGRPSMMDEVDHFDNFVARESIRFLENYAQENEPFFLVSSFLKPHDPFMPAKRFAEMFQPEQMKLPATWGKADLSSLPSQVRHSIEASPFTPELKDAAEARKRMAYYYGNLAQMDDCAGQVLNALNRLGLDRNTIIVYTADHGEMLGDLGLWAKFQFYEGSCGVPLTVRMPGAAPSVCDMPVSQISLVATLAELCGVDFTGPCDGKSFADLILHPGSHFNYGPVFAEYDLGTKNAKYMIRDGNFKYTYWTHDIPELYNLSSDPAEMHNLASLPEYQETVAQLRQKLLAWHRPPEG